MTLIVTGSIAIDSVSTPTAGAAEEVMGGSAAYFAAAASLYGPVRLVAAVGGDLPEGHNETFAKFPNIDRRGIEQREGSKTFRWGGKYLENMDERETMFTEVGVLAEAPPEVPAEFLDSKYVFLANDHPATQLTMLSRFGDAAFLVADTMDLWIETAKEQLTELLGKVTGLVLNYEEAEQFTGKRNPVTAGRAILELGPTFVVIKKGEHGAILVHKDGLAALPAYPAEEVIDPTGAGDTFGGAMMAQLAKTGDTSFDSIRRAMAHGTVMASFTIESFSLDRLASLSEDELRGRYNEYAAMTLLA